ncbi:MAG TPA: hypothetical protein VGH59_13075 [Casimicrobiaceae bacterium]
MRSTARTARLEQLSARIRDIPDQLALVHLDLKRLCARDARSIPLPVQDAIADACARLHQTLVEVTEIVRCVEDLEIAGDGAGAMSRPDAREPPAFGADIESDTDARKYSEKLRAS